MSRGAPGPAPGDTGAARAGRRGRVGRRVAAFRVRPEQGVAGEMDAGGATTDAA